MKCPNCQKELIIEPYVYNNVEMYNNTVIAKAKCCGYGVRVSRKVSFSVTQYEGKEEVDDWGDTLKQRTRH